MKIFVMWTHLSGYLVSNLNQACREGHEVFLIHSGDHSETPYGKSLDLSKLNALSSINLSAFQIRKQIAEINPDLVLICGWHISKYRNAIFASKHPIVFYMDNQWRGGFKQRVAVVLRKFLINPHFDFAFLPGKRQEEYALKLGIPQDRIWLGALNGDSEMLNNFRSIGLIDSFLYVGRLSEEKGILVLMEAYEGYRKVTNEPWTLHVVGDGSLRHHVMEKTGVNWIGFLNQFDLAKIYQIPSVFVMPSVREAWGVAIHEAALTGHPLIVTDACGAADALLVDNRNGFLVKADDSDSLKHALIRISGMEDRVLQEFSKVSVELAQPFNAKNWVEALVQIQSKVATSHWLQQRKSKSIMHRVMAQVVSRK